MSNTTKNITSPEQIKNNIPNMFKKLEMFLEKDEFGYFKSKTRRHLNQKISESESKIQKLLELKKRSETVYKTLAEKKKQLIIENTKLKESLTRKFESKVTK